jgi:alpha-L-rhamnosidase
MRDWRASSSSSKVPSALLFGILVLCLMLADQTSAGQDAHRNPPRNWRGSWITSNDVPPVAEAFLHFRKTFELESIPPNLLVYVSADNQFDLHVNGRRVGWGPAIGDPMHWHYETYDLAPFLHTGSNIIAATVWHLGDNAPMRQMSERLGFVLDCDADSAVDVKSGKTWEVEPERGLSTIDIAPAVKASYYVSSPGERFDGAQFDWGWDATANAGAWKKADVIGQASARGKNNTNTPWQLIADGLPPMERSVRSPGKTVRVVGLLNAADFPRSAVLIPPHTQGTILVDAGEVITAFPSLTLSGGRGASVTATYTEALYGPANVKGNRNDVGSKSARGVTDQFIPDGGQQRTFTPLDWRAWRFLELAVKTNDEPLTLEGLKIEYTAYPFTKLASFESDDAEMNRIWQTGWDTLRICAHDTYMDTPYWERLQYVGDTRIESLVTYATTDDDRLPREAIQAFHNSLLPDGITLSRYPTREFQSIPGFSLYYVGMVHDFWMYRNDPAFVRQQLSAIRSTLDFFRSRQNENGLLGLLPWWPFVDWANGFSQGIPPQTSSGDSAVLSLQFVEALRYASDLEERLGSPALAAGDRADARRIAEAVYKLCWSEQEHLLADTPDKTHFSQHANIYGVWMDSIPKDHQGGVMTKILSASEPAFAPNTAPEKISRASFYYRYYLTRALDHAGLGDRYMDTLSPWKVMLSNGLTTWAETPEPTRSDSHAWSAHPTYDLLTSVAGVRPGSPNFATVRIEPHLGNLRSVKAAVSTPRGFVRVEYSVSGKGVRAIVDLPAALPGILVWNGLPHTLAQRRSELELPPAR